MIHVDSTLTRGLATVASLVFCLALPVAHAVPPANDTCAGRQVIPGNGPFPLKTTTVDISGATTTGDPAFGVDCPSLASSSVWYEFRPQTSALYTISTCSDADPTLATTVADTVLAIYVDNGTPCSGFVQIACEDDVCGPDRLQAAITTQLAANTTYYIVAWRFGDDPPPPSPNAQLQLRVSQTVPPANDTCAAPTELPLNFRMAGSTIASANHYELPGSTAQGRDVVYGFTAPTTDSYSFAVRAYFGDDLVLYAASNCPPGPGPSVLADVVAVANRSSVSTAEEIFCLPLTAGQRIYLFVDETNTSHSGTSFVIDAVRCVREQEPNNGTNTAGALPCGLGGSINPAGDVDYYALGTFPTGYRAFAMVDASAGVVLDMNLRVETDDQVLEADSGDNDIVFGEFSSNVAGTPLTNKPVYLRVSHPATGQATEPYRLYAVVQPPHAAATLESEPNNTIATADPGTYFSGALGASDQDVFSFSAFAGDLIFVSLDGDPLRDSTRLNAQLALLDSSGATLQSVDNLESFGPPGEAMVYRVNNTGAYYVRVAATTGAASTGDYLLSIARNCFVNNGVNSPPAISSLVASSPASEGSVLTLNGAIFDPDAGEAFQLAISWGDGSPDTLTNLPAGLSSFEIAHTVLDDPPTGTASNAINLTLTVTDRGGATDSETVTPTLRNVTPSNLAISPEPLTLDESGSIVLTSAFTDPGAADTFVVTIHWGDGTTTTTNLQAGIRLFQAGHAYIDNATSVTVIVTDDDTGSVTNSAPITVNNVNPVLSNLAVTTPIPADSTATISGNYNDSSPADTFSLSIDWGDGSALQVFNYPAGPGAFSVPHQYTNAGVTMPVTLTLLDDDFGGVMITTNIVIGPRTGRPRFLSISNAPSSAIILKLQGTPSTTYRIEGSSNLQNWGTLGSRTAGVDGRFEFEDAALPRPPRSFYRAVTP
jgi:hypothetical protein